MVFAIRPQLLSHCRDRLRGPPPVCIVEICYEAHLPYASLQRSATTRPTFPVHYIHCRDLLEAHLPYALQRFATRPTSPLSPSAGATRAWGTPAWGTTALASTPEAEPTCAPSAWGRASCRARRRAAVFHGQTVRAPASEAWKTPLGICRLCVFAKQTLHFAARFWSLASLLDYGLCCSAVAVAVRCECDDFRIELARCGKY